RGFAVATVADGGLSNVDDVARFRPTALVGTSPVGRVAPETALAHPADVYALVLVSPALADHDWSDEIKDYWRREEELFEPGDVDAATQLTLDAFALPHVHDTLEPMVRRSYELQFGPEPEVSWPERRPLGSLRPRTLVLVGEHDLADFHAIAERIVREA